MADRVDTAGRPKAHHSDLPDKGGTAERADTEAVFAYCQTSVPPLVHPISIIELTETEVPVNVRSAVVDGLHDGRRA